MLYLSELDYSLLHKYNIIFEILDNFKALFDYKMFFTGKRSGTLKSDFVTLY